MNHNFIPISFRSVQRRYEFLETESEVTEYCCTRCGHKETFPKRFLDTKCDSETTTDKTVLVLSVLLIINGVLGLLSVV